jgi:hypothetical protein
MRFFIDDENCWLNFENLNVILLLLLDMMCRIIHYDYYLHIIIIPGDFFNFTSGWLA